MELKLGHVEGAEDPLIEARTSSLPIGSGE
jgi:hypothetical protein